MPIRVRWDVIKTSGYTPQTPVRALIRKIPLAEGVAAVLSAARFASRYMLEDGRSLEDLADYAWEGGGITVSTRPTWRNRRPSAATRCVIC